MIVDHRHHHAARTVVAAILVTFAALLLATAAQAYAPGELIWAQRLGTDTAQTGVRDIAGGPKGAAAIAGWQNLPADERVPLVARYGADGLEWVRTYEGRGETQAVAFDPAGDLYVVATVTPAGSDSPGVVLIKYDANGDLRWTAVWEGDGTYGAQARHVAVDKRGDVIVVATETVIDDAGRLTAPAVVVLKYHGDGSLAWPAAATYEPAAGDASIRTFELSDAALDRAGDVYVCGTLYSHWWGVGGETAGHALKLAGADGALVASHTDELRPGTDSMFERIAVRGSRVAVVGMALDMTGNGGLSDTHGLVAGFDLGLQDAHRREWDPAGTRYEAFNDVELDARGDVYLTGIQASPEATDLRAQAVTLKLDRSLSRVLWNATYAPEGEDAGTYLMVRDTNGDVYVAGVRRTGARAEWPTLDSQDFLTIKYSRTGRPEWVRTWSGGGPGYEGPCGLVLGARRDVYVAGQAWSADGVLQSALLRYQR